MRGTVAKRLRRIARRLAEGKIPYLKPQILKAFKKARKIQKQNY